VKLSSKIVLSLPRLPETAQDKPQTGSRQPRRSQDFLQTRPGHLKTSPRWAPIGPDSLKTDPMTASRQPPGPKRAQDSSKTDPRRPQTGPDPPKTNPRRPKRGPRQAQTHPRQAQDSPKPIQKGPIMGRYPVYPSPVEPQSPLFDAATVYWSSTSCIIMSPICTIGRSCQVPKYTCQFRHARHPSACPWRTPTKTAKELT
jgi:hypothetical protein